MKKIALAILAIILFSINASAQFIGSYSLKDGGVDVQNSQLCILPDNEFALASISGVFLGKWVQESNNKIVVTEIKTQQPIAVYAYKDVSNRTAFSSIKFKHFDYADAAVAFVKDSLASPIYYPVFNKEPNCFDYQYTSENDLSGIKTIQIVLHQDARFQHHESEYPYQAIVFNIPVSKDYNHYELVFDESALQEVLTFELTKRKDNYFVGEKQIGAREELTTKISDGITRYKMMLAAQQANGNVSHGTKAQKLPVHKNAETIAMNAPTEKPLFLASCEPAKIEVVEQNVPLKSGYYAAKIDAGKKKGFKAVGTDDYYILETIPAVTIQEVDSVYKEYNKEMERYSLTFKFNSIATKKWSAFTEKNVGQYVGLVIDHKLVSAANIVAAITGGMSSISGRYTEQEINKLKTLLEKEMKK